VGSPTADRVDALRAAGFPPEAEVGLSGLERMFDGRLSGTPGGVLLAGSRPLGRGHSRPDPPLRTSIDPAVQSAATEALAGRYGGVAALRPRTGEVLGLAGVAFSAPQPPGSTFKIVTAAAALQNGLVTRTSSFPFQSSTRLEGVELQNANGETCGGTFEQAFAQSCNSVFAPLGAKLGARRLVAAARRFGFDGTRPLPGAAPSSIPDAGKIGDDLAVGSSAIGQGRVQATALQMAVVAATIAGHGRRPRLTLLPRRRGVRVRATSSRVAQTVERLMVDTVRFGTGTAAAIPGIEVAGKTGTAELRQTVTPADQQDAARGTPDETGSKSDPTDTDAWFAGYAPAKNPRLAVCVLLVRAGAGGDTAAPAARAVLQAGLG
jgi:cell division protein FtsI/penicillin-binding protein 2